MGIRKNPDTYMVISSDLGAGLHPGNKYGYGTRAARIALSVVYGQKTEYYGPVYQSHEIKGNKILIRFTHVGQGLAFKHGDRLQGFSVSGEDKVFHWAEAKLDGDVVVVTCENVNQPVSVRYAWCEKRPWANLFNKDGFPALPFRTDEWP
jgi:sialate O-acetylesterase